MPVPYIRHNRKKYKLIVLLECIAEYLYSFRACVRKLQLFIVYDKALLSKELTHKKVRELTYRRTGRREMGPLGLEPRTQGL